MLDVSLNLVCPNRTTCFCNNHQIGKHIPIWMQEDHLMTNDSKGWEVWKREDSVVIVVQSNSKAITNSAYPWILHFLILLQKKVLFLFFVFFLTRFSSLSLYKLSWLPSTGERPDNVGDLRRVAEVEKFRYWSGAPLDGQSDVGRRGGWSTVERWVQDNVIRRYRVLIGVVSELESFHRRLESLTIASLSAIKPRSDSKKCMPTSTWRCRWFEGYV